MIPRNSDFTILTAVDEKYIDKLIAVLPTWEHFKPEIKEMPIIVMYDDDALPPPDRDIKDKRSREMARFTTSEYGQKIMGLAMMKRDKPILCYPWSMKNAATQREKMLTSLVYGVEHVRTPWFIKLDADTVAVAKGKWIDFRWFEEKEGQHPVFITNPWGYTKPAEFLSRLDDWGDESPALASFPRLNIHVEPGARRAYHSRIISWLFIGDTEWAKSIIQLVPEMKLPVPSQDTFLWYIATRTKRRYITVRMKRKGWNHLGRRDAATIRNFCQGLAV